MERNRTLDRLRAFAMLWTVLIHVLYFGEFFSSKGINAVKSWLLLEMPLIFFIMGTSNRLSREDAYHRTVLKRWGKMMIPYWVYGMICVVIILSDLSKTAAPTNDVIGKTVLSWLIPMDTQISHMKYLTWSIWFVPVYLVMVLLMPLMKKMASSQWPMAWGLVLVLSYVVSLILGSDLLQNVAFYGLFVYAGHFFPDWQEDLIYQPLRGFLWAFVILVLVALGGLLFAGVDMDMQFRKFPPDPLFLLYSVGTLSGVLLITPTIDGACAQLERFRPLRYLIDLYAKRSLTVFLYQPLFFLWAVPMINKIIVGPNFGPELARMLLCAVIAFPACAIPAILLGKLEDLIRVFPKIKDRSESV